MTTVCTSVYNLIIEIVFTYGKILFTVSHKYPIYVNYSSANYNFSKKDRSKTDTTMSFVIVQINSVSTTALQHFY